MICFTACTALLLFARQMHLLLGFTHSYPWHRYLLSFHHGI
nr:MAG TPA: hypothetical protein [Caudoviricetes sp.]